MLYNCNLFQPQIKYIVFTLSSQHSLWISHKALRTNLLVFWETLPILYFCGGVEKLGVDVVCRQAEPWGDGEVPHAQDLSYASEEPMVMVVWLRLT